MLSSKMSRSSSCEVLTCDAEGFPPLRKGTIVATTPAPRSPRREELEQSSKLVADRIAKLKLKEGRNKSLYLPEVMSAMPPPSILRRERSQSEGSVVQKRRFAAGLVEVSWQEVEPLPLRVRLAVERCISNGGRRRRRLNVVVESRSRRATLSIDGSLLLFIVVIFLAFVCGRVHALSPHTAAATARLRKATRHLAPSKANALDSALTFAHEAHKGQFRKSGDPYIIHPIETACLLAEMNAPPDAIVAGLLHDTVEDNAEVSVEQICAHFGRRVAAIVDGVTDEKHAELTKQENDEKNLRELFLAMGTDLNVVLVKLADRLHNMRTLGAMPALKRHNKARETLEFYVPLARMVGVPQVETELRALSTAHLSPLGEHFPNFAESILSSFPHNAVENYATTVCPAVLDDYLNHDDLLRSLPASFDNHKRIFKKMCLASEAGKKETDKEGVLSHLSALYTTVLLAGFSAVPSASAHIDPTLETISRIIQGVGA